jgi:hypothetical protein
MRKVIIVDNVPGDPSREDRERRPHAVWGLSEKPDFGDAMKYRDMLLDEERDLRGTLTFVHVNDPHNEVTISVDGQRIPALANLGELTCAHGGRLFVFSGGRINELPLSAIMLVKNTKQALEAAGFEDGTHFIFGDWHDVDPKAVRRVAEGRDTIGEAWRVHSLLRDIPDAMRSALGVVELFAGRSVPLRLVAGLDSAELRERFLERWMPSGEDDERIEAMVAWAEGRKGDELIVPAEAVEWLAAVRRTLRSKSEKTGEQEAFERQRDHLSHSLFGNSFAQKLGTGGTLCFLEGYWRYRLVDADATRRDGDQSEEQCQWESVEGALQRWQSIHSALCAFATAWEAEPANEPWQIRLREAGEMLDALVIRIPELATGSEIEKQRLKEALSRGIAAIRDILFGLKPRQTSQAAAGSRLGASP